MAAYPRLDYLTALRLQRDVEHLGARATAEFLLDLTDRIGGRPAALSLLAEYGQRITLEMVRAADGGRFPARQLHLVPPA